MVLLPLACKASYHSFAILFLSRHSSSNPLDFCCSEEISIMATSSCPLVSSSSSSRPSHRAFSANNRINVSHACRRGKMSAVLHGNVCSITILHGNVLLFSMAMSGRCVGRPFMQTLLYTVPPLPSYRCCVCFPNPEVHCAEWWHLLGNWPLLSAAR